MTSHMIANTRTTERRSSNEPDGLDSRANALLGTILAIGSILIFWNARELTPDFVYRINAAGLGILLLLGCCITGSLLFLGGGAAFLRSKNDIASILMLPGIFVMVWWSACAMTPDYVGGYNPYMRRMEPLGWQSEKLLEAKSLPRVADQIRQAARDGRIDRGEAHDILSSQSYFDAIGEDERRRQVEIHRRLLTD